MSQKEKPVIVTVSDERMEKIQDVADELAARGMKVDRVMPLTGMISGSCPSDAMSGLEAVDGVQSVEEEASAELPPPDSDVQ